MRAWPQSGQMFIAHVGTKNSPAPEERNVLASEANISLRWSFRLFCRPGSISIWSLRDQELERGYQQIYPENSGVTPLVLIGRT